MAAALSIAVVRASGADDDGQDGGAAEQAPEEQSLQGHAPLPGDGRRGGEAFGGVLAGGGTAERRVGEEGDVQLLAAAEHRAVAIAVDAEVVLDGPDRGDLHRLVELRQAHVRQPDRGDLPGPPQLVERSDRLADGWRLAGAAAEAVASVGPVHVEETEPVDAQRGEAVVDVLAQALG